MLLFAALTDCILRLNVDWPMVRGSFSTLALVLATAEDEWQAPGHPSSMVSELKLGTVVTFAVCP